MNTLNNIIQFSNSVALLQLLFLFVHLITSGNRCLNKVEALTLVVTHLCVFYAFGDDSDKHFSVQLLRAS